MSGMKKSKILTVDDNEVNLKMLRIALERSGYEVIAAVDGVEALEVVREQKPDLVLLDIMMPKKDGLEVCEDMKKDPATEDIPVIFLKAKSNPVDKVRGLAVGAVDYVTKPFDFVEVLARVRTQLQIKKLHTELVEKNQQLEEALHQVHEKNERIQKDITAAGALQRQLLPKKHSFNGKLDFAWKFIPSSHVAGDIFNVMPLDDDHYAVYMVDVAGHGVQSAMLAVSIFNFFRSAVEIGNRNQDRREEFFYDPKKVAVALNDNFSMDTFETFFTCIYMVVNSKTGEVSMVNAGHPFPLLLLADGAHKFIEHGDLPIGMMADSSYEAVRFKLEKGDRCILYTDGLYEIAVDGKFILNKDSVAEFLAKSWGDLDQRFEKIVDEFLSLSDQKEFTDDVSLLGFEL